MVTSINTTEMLIILNTQNASDWLLLFDAPLSFLLMDQEARFRLDKIYSTARLRIMVIKNKIQPSTKSAS